MVSLIKKIVGDQKGAALAETAIALPVIFCMLIGFTFFTSIIKDGLAMQAAARIGARHYAVHNDSVEAKELTREKLEDSGIFLDEDRGDRIVPVYAHTYGVGIKVDRHYSPFVFLERYLDMEPFVVSRAVIIHRTAEDAY